MLIGAGYDAYCVHGYATREICTLDETLEVCPLLRKTQEVRCAVSSACSFPVSSTVELGETTSGLHWVSVCIKQGPHQRHLLSGLFHGSLRALFGFSEFLLPRSNTANSQGMGTGRCLSAICFLPSLNPCWVSQQYPAFVDTGTKRGN